MFYVFLHFLPYSHTVYMIICIYIISNNGTIQFFAGF